MDANWYPEELGGGPSVWGTLFTWPVGKPGMWLSFLGMKAGIELEGFWMGQGPGCVGITITHVTSRFLAPANLHDKGLGVGGGGLPLPWMQAQGSCWVGGREPPAQPETSQDADSWCSQPRCLTFYACVCVLVTQRCLTLCDPMGYSPPGSCLWDSPGTNNGVG